MTTAYRKAHSVDIESPHSNNAPVTDDTPLLSLLQDFSVISANGTEH